MSCPGLAQYICIISKTIRALPPCMMRNVISMVVDALAQLHATNIVHTDVKLDNLLFGSSLYPMGADLQRYLDPNPAQVEGECYPVIRSQPIPNHYV